MGVNGAAGNSQDLNIVFGIDAKRKSGLNTVTLDCDYLLTQEDTELTKNRLNTLGRFERDIPDSAWNYFSDGWFEYDQFKDFDSKIGLHAGRGVLLRETCKSKLTARFGGGTSKEFGSADDAWKPEGLAGLACECKLTSRQKLVASLDYFPNVGDLNSFRVHARASWELLLDEEMNLSLKASAFDAYDNTPSGSDLPNDIDYSLSLHWGF